MSKLIELGRCAPEEDDGDSSPSVAQNALPTSKGSTPREKPAPRGWRCPSSARGLSGLRQVEAGLPLVLATAVAIAPLAGSLGGEEEHLGHALVGVDADGQRGVGNPKSQDGSVTEPMTTPWSRFPSSCLISEPKGAVEQPRWTPLG